MGDKTRCILFKKGKKKNKQYPVLKISRDKNKIKQYSLAEYLGCLHDENISGESMAKRALKEFIGKQTFFIGRVGTYHTL